MKEETADPIAIALREDVGAGDITHPAFRAAWIAGLVGVLVMYHLMTIAPINVISPVTAVLAG